MYNIVSHAVSSWLECIPLGTLTPEAISSGGYSGTGIASNPLEGGTFRVGQSKAETPEG